MNRAWANGFVGMLIFSGSMPATRAAVAAFDPVFLTLARAAIAGLAAAVTLLALRQAFPQRRDFSGLGAVALACVIGFPLLTALALKRVNAVHSLAFIGLLPLATATFGALLGSERPRLPFWLFSLAGAAAVVGYAFGQGFTASPGGDLLMLAAVIICGFGYAEGARLSRRLGGWQVISWALVLSLPIVAPLALARWPEAWREAPLGAWAGLAYVSLFSMFIGFFFWYRGLAEGGVAAVGQLQLAQPFFGLALSSLILHESVGWPIIAVGATVAVCVAGAKRFAS
jgi:drug/metabolite transporter (DMT)-like permease